MTDADTITLQSLRIEDAEAMVEVLADPDLYAVTGGQPPTLEQLQDRYARQVRGGPSDGGERWLNWIVLDSGDHPVGYVQATVRGVEAELAWVIGTRWQGRGYARRAARSAMEVLSGDGVEVFVAHIHPGHRASERVAEALGLQPTDAMVDGERRWSTDA